MTHHTRRAVVGGVIASATAGPLCAAEPWDPGPLRHILPSVSHDSMLIKASLGPALEEPPLLDVGGRRAAGEATAGDGRQWRFRIGGLQADTSYRLRIVTARHGTTDPWPLRTAPPPASLPNRFRLLAFTCAGGDEATVLNGRRAFIPLSTRRALLRRGLDFAPDAVLAIGDHIYWDQESGLRRNGGAPSALSRQLGLFSSDATTAEDLRILAEIGRRQVADLYGAMLRSTPVWFVRDDHDYFENDEFYGDRGTFPPEARHRVLAERLQAMFWPEFLRDSTRPARLPGSDASFGTLRWGRLVEGLLYDCRGHMAAHGPEAAFIPAAVEDWIAQRTRDRDVRHVVQVPSTPWGWTAGKWGEWYPDALRHGETPPQAKPGWQRGWFEQHQRLLQLAGSRGRDSLVVSGDLHAVGCGQILSSDDVRPESGVHTLLAGPLGTDDLAFPSAFRSTPPFVPASLRLETFQPPLEKNGFSVLDFTPGEIRIRQFAWRSPTPEAEIAHLEPTLDRVQPVRA